MEEFLFWSNRTLKRSILRINPGIICGICAIFPRNIFQMEMLFSHGNDEHVYLNNRTIIFSMCVNDTRCKFLK